MESGELKEKIKPILALFLALLIIIVVILAGRYLFNSRNLVKNVDYLVPNVPYVGIFNHKGELAKFETRDTHAAIYSVMEYWNPSKNNPDEINFYLEKLNSKSEKDIVSFFEEKHPEEYLAKSINFSSINDFKEYINPDARTPLIMLLPIDKEQMLEVYNPARILIGMDESKKILIFHDFWLGNNYEISFDDFNKIVNNSSKKFVVVQPINLEEKVKELASRPASSYSARTKNMTDCEKTLKNFVIGRAAAIYKVSDSVRPYIEKVKNDSCFEQLFPPNFKVGTYLLLANLEKSDKNYSEALSYANKAVELNHDFDKPVGEWPGYDINGNANGVIDKSCEPYWVLGNIYMETGDLLKAKENYEKAVSFDNYICREAKKGLGTVNNSLLTKDGSN